MTKTRTRLLILSLFLLAALCTVLFITANALLSLPYKAEALYGPPAPYLSQTEVLTLSYQLLNAQDALLTAPNPSDTLIEFTIETDQPVSTITSNLQTQNLIADPQAFTNYLIYSGIDRQIQAGTYTLTPALTPVEIALTLIDATPKNITFTLLPGLRIEEVAQVLSISGFGFSPEEFIVMTQQRPIGITFITEIPYDGTIEGFLFPDTYTISRTATVEEVFKILLQNFERQVTPDIKSGFTNQGLSLYQGVILASIVEREAVIHEEQPIIASVFHNRLNNQMPLETDPTVQYALGYNPNQSTWWTNPLTLADLQLDSPYNTYIYPGLPPGAIANPGLDAMRAVAFPAESNYLFFRSACDGSGAHNFSFTFDEHLANDCN